MTKKLFLTGATGYIGGDFLHILAKRHPGWKVSCLVRNSEKASVLLTSFPHVRIVEGDLDSLSLIESEASQADIVYHFAHSDHIRSARAIAKGLARNPAKSVYWIHTSGAGILTFENFAQDSFGDLLPSDSKVFDDWDHITELTSLPDRAIHRHVDKVVLAASEADPTRIKTAIVSPSCIFGVGRGANNTSSVQVHVAARVALSAGKAIQVGGGTNIWHEVHIHDLSELYLLLGEAAASGSDRATWNEHGYYLAETDSFVWGDIIKKIAGEAHAKGFLPAATVSSVDAETAKSHHQHFPALCGTTSRGVAKRGRLLLGWQPSRRRMLDEIPTIVDQEAARLGLSSSSSKAASRSRL